MQIPYHLHLALSYSLKAASLCKTTDSQLAQNCKIQFCPWFLGPERLEKQAKELAEKQAAAEAAQKKIEDRLLLKAGCRWEGICTIGVENLVGEVIL